ncbi:MAG: XRE family transcriptional regulator [Dehalococcoidia bacterium]
MSRNVFVDLGFSDDEAVELALRVMIAVRLEQLIRHRQLTARQAGRQWGVPEAMVRQLLQSRSTALSLGALMRLLIAAGVPFDIRRGASPQDVDVVID